MDLRQLEYIVAIAENESISKAAQTLFISQSGLNQQLIKLEKELGVPLFYRDNHHLQLTQGGKIYVNSAREILSIRKKAYSQLKDLAGNITGEILLGLTPEHGIDMFTNIFPEFTQNFPGITLNLKESMVKQQHELLLKGKLDLGFVMVSPADKVDLTYVHLFNERLVLGVPRSHPQAQKYQVSPNGPLPTIDLSLFSDDFFSLMFKGSTMRPIIDACFEYAGFRPKILFETSMNHVLSKMVSKNLCCTILPQSQAIRDENSAWFHISSHPFWEIAMAYNKRNPPGRARTFLLQQAQIYGKKMEHKLNMQ